MARNKDNYNAWMRAWRAKNRDKVSAASKSWRERNRDKYIANRKRWEAANPDKVKAHARRKYERRDKQAVRLRAAEYRRNNPEKRRQWEQTSRDKDPTRFVQKRKRHWQRHLALQELAADRPRPDQCEHCGRPGKVVWDHDHETGHWRSWPCHKCNTVMGLVDDRPEVLRRLADTIEQHKQKHGNQVLLQERSDNKSILK